MDIGKLKKKIPEKLHSLGLSVWDRIVQHNIAAVDPMAISQYVDSRTPELCDKIASMIDRPVIHDLYYAHSIVEDDSLGYKTAGELLVARVIPNILHLTDVEFSNPYHPIPAAQRRHQLQHFAGLGLLGPLIENMVAVGTKLGCQSIVLVAGSIDLIPAFERHGFEVEETETAQAALRMGAGPSMERML